MSLIPTFEIGVWNAWILIVPILVISTFAVRAIAVRESGQTENIQLTTKENRIINVMILPMVVSVLYAVFLSLRLGSTWLYIGLPIYLFGVVFTIVAILNPATSPKDKVIAKGLYRASRPPIYVGILLMQIGVGITCSSWLYLLLTLVLLILLNANLSAEERYCLYRYGDTYHEYMSKTPKWIGIPK